MSKENQTLTFSKNKTFAPTATADVNTSLGNIGMEVLKGESQAISKQITESKDMSTKEKIVALDKNRIIFLLEIVLFCGIVKRI